jgi:hypothetical protein
MTLRNFIFLFVFTSCGGKTSQKLKPIVSNKDTIKKFTSNNDSDSIYKIGNFLFVGDKDLVFDIINNHNPPQKLKSKGDTIYTDNDTTILVDNKKAYGSVYKKYSPEYNFDLFKVNRIYKGKFAKPNLKTDPNSYSYKTMIRNDCLQDTANFAGHYTIAEWGCGMGCAMMAVIDRISGKVYYSQKFFPFDADDGHWGIRYRKDSRLILVNSYLLEDYLGYVMQDWRKVGYYEWTDNGFVKLK